MTQQLLQWKLSMAQASWQAKPEVRKYLSRRRSLLDVHRRRLNVSVSLKLNLTQQKLSASRNIKA
jgi:hypothetical protein